MIYYLFYTISIIDSNYNRTIIGLIGGIIYRKPMEPLYIHNYTYIIILYIYIWGKPASFQFLFFSLEYIDSIPILEGGAQYRFPVISWFLKLVINELSYDLDRSTIIRGMFFSILKLVIVF